MSRAWMPMYWGDYLADTPHFSTAQHGAYLLLIAFYWCNGKLPSDENEIRKIAKCSPLAWRKIRSIVMAKFDSMGRHKRIDIELAKAIEKSQVNSANAMRRHHPVAADPQCYSHSQSEKKDKEAKASLSGREAKASRLPDNWQPNADDSKEARNIGLQLYEIDNEIEKFRDYWHARADKGAVKRDWSATWRNWCRKAIENKTNGNSNGRKLQDDRLSVGKAAGRLAELSEFELPPRPSLVSGTSTPDRRMLPKG